MDFTNYTTPALNARHNAVMEEITKLVCNVNCWVPAG